MPEPTITRDAPPAPAAPSTRRPPRGRRPRLRRRLGTLAAIAAGGALGTSARVEIARIVPAGPGIPWQTFLVNIVGSLVLGFVATLLVERAAPTRYVGPLVATGFCGSFTTFSTFAVELDLRLRSGDVAPAFGYAAAALVMGVAAVAGGIVLARTLARREAG